MSETKSVTVAYIDQTICYSEEGEEKGNSLSACLASLLGFSLDDIPDYTTFGDQWFAKFAETIRLNNYRLRGSYYFDVKEHKPTWKSILQLSPGIDGIFIATGYTSRGYSTIGHHVLYKEGKLLHDPHPSREGITLLKSVYIIEKEPAVCLKRK